MAGFPKTTKSAGFSLIELMVTLVIAAILLSVGVPSLAKFVSRARATKQITELVDSFQLARQYAINAKTHVTICGSSNGLVCDKGWQQGFIVFSHGGQSAEFLNKIDTPLLYHYKTGDDFSTQANIKKFTYRPAGILKGQSGSLLYCPEVDAEKYIRRIVVSRGGRIRIYDKNQLAKISYLSEMNCG